MNQASQLAELAFGYAQAQQHDQAIMLLSEAQTYAGGDCFEANAWLKIGAAYQAAGDQAQADKFLTQAAETAVKNNNESDCYGGTSPTESLLNRSAEYSEAGYLDLGLQLANLTDDLLAPLTLAKIVRDYAEADRIAEAKEILTQAITDHQLLIAQLPAGSSLEPEMIPQSEPSLEGEPSNQLLPSPEKVSPDAWDIYLSNRLLIGMAASLIEADQLELAAFFVEQSDLLPMQPSEAAQPSGLSLETLDIDYQLTVVRLLIELDQPERALSLLNITTPKIQIAAVSSIEAVYSWVRAAQFYAQMKDPQANEALAEAQTLAEQITAQGMSGSARASVVGGYAEIGDFEKARSLADSIDNFSDRQNAYGEIAMVYAQSGEIEAANSIVESMGNPQGVRLNLMHTYLFSEQYSEAQQIAQQPDMLEFLSSIGYAYCNAGLPERIVTLLESNYPEDDSLRACAATTFAAQGEFDRALDLVQTIKDASRKADALIGIASEYTRPETDCSNRGWLPLPWQRWFGQADAAKATELLDQARSLLE